MINRHFFEQARRLRELNAKSLDLKMTFNSKTERERFYQKIEKDLVASQRQHLQNWLDSISRPALCRLENRLAEVMIENGFSQVTTPIIMSAGLGCTPCDLHILSSLLFSRNVEPKQTGRQSVLCIGFFN